MTEEEKPVAAGHNRLWLYVLVGCAVLGWLAVAAPSPEFFLVSSDGGHQLTGGTQLLTLGEHPYLDYFETYGPLTFYASALAQWLTGLRPGGEIALNILGWALGYLLLFRLLLLIFNRVGPSLAVLALALLLLPQFYKYYCVLLPFLSLTAAQLYLARPGWRALAGLAATVAVAWLFRHDFGVYNLLMALTAVLSDPAKSWRSRGRAGLGLIGLSALFCLPWFLFLLAHQAGRRYFAMIIFASTAMSRGLMLPHPLLNWQDPWLSCCYLAFFLLPVGDLFLLWRRRRAYPSALLRLQLAGVVLALASLVQSSHRADFYHLLEGIPPDFLCLATIGHLLRPGPKAAEESTSRRSPWRGGATIGLTLTLLILAWQSAPYPLLASHWPPQLARKASYYTLTRRPYIDRLVKEDPKFWPARLVQAIRDRLTRPGERIAIYPFFMKFNYFAERPFAAGLMLLAPGYFDSEGYLQEAITKLRRQKVRYVLWDETFRFDGLPARNPVRSSALLHAAVVNDYQNLGQLYGFTVYRRKE